MKTPVLFRQYRTLDAILVVYCLSIVGGIVAALIFVSIPQTQLAILAGLAGSVLGVITGYAAARFGTPSQQAGGGRVEPTGTAPEPVTIGPPPNQGSGGIPPEPQTVNIVHTFTP